MEGSKIVVEYQGGENRSATTTGASANAATAGALKQTSVLNGKIHCELLQWG